MHMQSFCPQYAQSCMHVALDLYTNNVLYLSDFYFKKGAQTQQ